MFVESGQGEQAGDVLEVVAATIGRVHQADGGGAGHGQEAVDHHDQRDTAPPHHEVLPTESRRQQEIASSRTEWNTLM